MRNSALSRRLSMRLLMVLAVALVTALSIVGCGGDGDSASTSRESAALASESGPLTRTEFIEQADLICKKADEAQYDKAGRYRVEHRKELAKLSPVAAEEKLLRVIVLPVIMGLARELEDLGAPQGEETKVKAVIAELEAGVRKARKNPYGIELETGYKNPLAKYINLARAYGFNDCRNPA